MVWKAAARCWKTSGAITLRCCEKLLIFGAKLGFFVLDLGLVALRELLTLETHALGSKAVLEDAVGIDDAEDGGRTAFLRLGARNSADRGRDRRQLPSEPNDARC